ncbi:MAG: hypothetical protein K0Q50_536 [Vampirovibrio sp.]|nr:hypothetical protein [Vampirovibrio sp.]
MQYSFERWTRDESDLTEAMEALSEPLPVEQVVQPFPFSEDLRELEASLSLDLEEGLDAFQQHRQSGFAASAEELHHGNSDWDELAKLVAEHVMAYMAESPAQTELDMLRAKLNEYYADNRSMADHVQRLVEENEALRISVSACELELATFRNVIGNVYLKR